MFSLSSSKKTVAGISFLFCIPFFLWTDAAVDPTLALRQTYLAVLLFATVLFFSFRKIPFALPVSLLRSNTLLLLAGYVLLCWISIVHTQSFSASIFELSKITLFYFLVLFFCWFYLLPSGPGHRIVALITLSSALLVIIGYAEFFYYTEFLTKSLQNMHTNIVYATFGNRNVFSEMVLLFIPFQVIYFFQNKTPWIKRATGLLVALSLLLILFMETRACWVALIIAPALLLLLTAKKILSSPFSHWKGARGEAGEGKPRFIGEGVRSNLILAAALILTIGLCAFPVYKNISQRITSTFEQLKEKNTINSVNERLVWWEKTTQMIKEQPLGGIGPGNWMIVFPKYNLSGTHAERGELSFRQPHNDYLWIWAESGIFALMLYVFYLLSMIVLSFKIIYAERFSFHEKIMAACSLFGILCFMIISFFAFPKERIEHLVLLALFSAFLLSIYFSRAILSGDKNISFKNSALLISFCVAAIGAFNLKGEVHAKNAEIARLQGDFIKTIDEGNKAGNLFFHIAPTGIPIDFYSGIGNYHLKNFKAAISSFQAALSHSPYHVLVLHFLATSYAMLGDENNAVQYYERALAISDKLDYSKINLALSYYNLAKYTNAFNMLIKIDDMNIIKKNLPSVRAILTRFNRENAQQEKIPGINNLSDEDLMKEFRRLKHLRP